jgi:hypothetical protein
MVRVVRRKKHVKIRVKGAGRQLHEHQWTVNRQRHQDDGENWDWI